MTPQYAYAQEPDLAPALWLDYAFATVEREEDFSDRRYGGVYIFAEFLGPEWGVLPNGRLYCDGRIVSEQTHNGDSGRPFGKQSNLGLAVTGRKIDQFGRTLGWEYPLWWPIYVAQADNLGEELAENKYMDKDIGMRKITHVHLLAEPDEECRQECVKALIEKFNPAINQLLGPRDTGRVIR